MQGLQGQHFQNIFVKKKYTVSCNQIGKINDRIAAIGSSVIVAPTGEIIAKADNKPCTLYAQLDLNVVKHWKSVYPISSID